MAERAASPPLPAPPAPRAGVKEKCEGGSAGVGLRRRRRELLGAGAITERIVDDGSLQEEARARGSSLRLNTWARSASASSTAERKFDGGVFDSVVSRVLSRSGGTPPVTSRSEGSSTATAIHVIFLPDSSHARTMEPPASAALREAGRESSSAKRSHGRAAGHRESLADEGADDRRRERRARWPLRRHQAPRRTPWRSSCGLRGLARARGGAPRPTRPGSRAPCCAGRAPRRAPRGGPSRRRRRRGRDGLHGDLPERDGE